MRIAGAILIVFGLLACLTIIGIPFGLFLMVIGTILVIVGGRKTIITNVVQVSNAPPQSFTPDRDAAPYVPEVKQVAAPRERATLAPPIDVMPARTSVFSPGTTENSGDDYDRRKWQALLKYDPEIAKVANKLRELGDEWVDEFAKSYLAINDKSYLPTIVNQIIVDARKQEAARR